MNIQKVETLNQLATSIFVEELVRQGVTDCFIAPGSRSTPLVLACAENPSVTVHNHYDERGLGFFALGLAKKTLRPPLIITTSGTAVANLLPAVVEAYYSQTPLIVCSADRPEELINVGANQAITQKDIFTNFVCDSFQISALSEKSSLDNLLSLAGHSVFRATTQKAPVHINWMFQEPLAPLVKEEVNIPPKISQWFDSKKPYVQTLSPKNASTDLDLEFLTAKSRVLLIFGSLIDNSSKDILLKIAAHLNAPVFCDVQNPLRFLDFKQNISRFDLMLAWKDFSSLKPDTIIHIGGPLTSKNLNKYIESFEGDYIQVQNFSKRMDFMNLSKTLVHASPNDFCQAICEKTWQLDSQYLNELKDLSLNQEEFLQKEFKDLNEMSLPYHLVANIKDANYFIGSSMPIRDLERFAGTGEGEFVFNRGASGIDGNIATAAGFALSSEKKTICVLGDQAFLYDINSLALTKNTPKAFHTVVINNKGGGIFSFLPVAQIDKSIFSKNFTHPHEWNLKSAADLYHLKYQLVQTPQDLIAALESNESSVIEIRSEIQTNIESHRSLTSKIKKAYE